MAVRAKADLKIVDNVNHEAEHAIVEAAKQAAPMVQRLSTHRDRFDLAIKELESERFELLSRRDHLRRQAEAVEQGFAIHLEDIENTLKMYEGGINSLGLPSSEN
ncbi:hypothetical protein IC608_10405 [Devosia sp. PTR5]|uniref:Uncharacterized protein n=1 Tax=Devosia oryzisoli TaxID=2774138 RepID=A0A927FUT1_9HYPH|nr:hypothetical protein [Devosia oryzisoli]MBD8065887.1 hypothetical protein [Devosia oryzisoli]